MCQDSVSRPDNFHYFKVSDLPLPRSIKCTIGKLSMRDFHIDLERLGPKDHVRKCYPAPGHLTGEDILIKIFPKSEHFSPCFLSFQLLLILNIIHLHVYHTYGSYQTKRDSKLFKYLKKRFLLVYIHFC